MQDSKIHSAPILARVRVENLHEDWAHTKEQKELFAPFGPGGNKYATCHGLFSEDQFFSSKEELLASI